MTTSRWVVGWLGGLGQLATSCWLVSSSPQQSCSTPAHPSHPFARTQEFYALLSCAAPGLLGEPGVFKRIYATPIARGQEVGLCMHGWGIARAASYYGQQQPPSIHLPILHEPMQRDAKPEEKELGNSRAGWAQGLDCFLNQAAWSAGIMHDEASCMTRHHA